MFRHKETRGVAEANGYKHEEVEAGIEYMKRKWRLAHPPGEFDSSGLFRAAERTARVAAVRSPSRRFPYPEMNAARTVAHVAEVWGVDPFPVRRIGKALESENGGNTNDSAHAALDRYRRIQRALKP